MKKMKTLTVNGQTYDIEDADSAASLIVAMDTPNKKCSHTAGQIYDHVQAGGLAVALAAGEYLPLTVCSSEVVSFGQTAVDGSGVKTLEITVDGSGQITVKDVTVATSGGGGTGGGASVDDVIEELEKTNLTGLTTSKLLFHDDEPTDISMTIAGCNVITFCDEISGDKVVLRGIAPAEQDDDAVNFAQFAEAVGDIESALDGIIAMQNSLIGGEGA